MKKSTKGMIDSNKLLNKLAELNHSFAQVLLDCDRNESICLDENLLNLVNTILDEDHSDNISCEQHEKCHCNHNEELPHQWDKILNSDHCRKNKTSFWKCEFNEATQEKYHFGELTVAEISSHTTSFQMNLYLPGYKKENISAKCDYSDEVIYIEGSNIFETFRVGLPFGEFGLDLGEYEIIDHHCHFKSDESVLQFRIKFSRENLIEEINID